MRGLLLLALLPSALACFGNLQAADSSSDRARNFDPEEASSEGSEEEPSEQGSTTAAYEYEDFPASTNAEAAAKIVANTEDDALL